MSQFAMPDVPSGGLDYAALNGALLMIQVLSVEEHVPTVHTTPGQKSPAIRANVTVLDGASSGETYEDTLIFPKLLQAQLRAKVGQLVLGRMTKGLAKPGQSAPWILDPPSDNDVAVADAHVRKVATPAITSAQPPF